MLFNRQNSLLFKVKTLNFNLFKSKVNFNFSSIHTVVMLRHGESIWNVENRFTGWCDVPLTSHGELEAKDAGLLIGERGLKFDVAFTSNLERAWRTCAITLAAAGQSGVETIRSSKLNERHYGALQGHFKDSSKLLEVFGNDKVMEWRKSYHTPPPSIDDLDFLSKIEPSHPYVTLSEANQKYIDAHRQLYDPILNNNKATPKTESLKLCEERAFGYWKDVIAPRVLKGQRVLIVAHANTIRALVKAVDKIQDNDIVHLKIPNGIPLVYTMDESLQPCDESNDIGFQAQYLVSAKNHSKMMAYERCVRKKLRGLFKYLDTDGDGRITPDCLLNGLAKLHSDNTLNGNNIFELAAVAKNLDAGSQAKVVNIEKPMIMGNGSVYTLESHSESRIQSNFCEYSIEELIRCIPDADEYGGITLKSFLEAEETLLPKLTHLKLLQ